MAPSAAQWLQEDNIAALLAVALEDDTVLVPEAARRRRLMSGADTSSSKFEEAFEQAARCVANGLDLLQPDVLTHDASVLERTRAMLKELAAEFPDLPEEMYRLIMLAAHFAEGRVPERPMLVDATVLIWMIEGERHLRVHRGFLYVYNEDGCFVMYSGIPPEIVLTRVQRFMRILEGILRRLRPSVRRQGASVAAAIVADMQSLQTVQDFLDACREAASRRVRPQENGRLEDTEMEADAEPAQQDDHCWTDDMASRVVKVFCANTANTRVIFEESWDMDRLIAYAYGFPHRRVLAHKRVSGRILEVVLGHGTLAGLMCRPTLSTFNALYRFINVQYDRPAKLWDTVRDELRCFRGLMMFLHADWTRQWNTYVSACDASEQGFGVVSAIWQPDEVARVGRGKLGSHSARD